MIFRNFFTNSFGILASRILGFIRDLLMASIIGANIYSDMFFVAFKLPNLFRRIFAEGAFTQAFLPAFIKAKTKGIFALNIFIKFTIFILFLTLLVVIFSPYITKIFAYGFSDEQIRATAPLVSINFFYLILIYIVTFIASLLQYKSHFATTAFGTVLLNIAMIIALLLSDINNPAQTIYNLSYGVLVGGFLQMIFHIYALKKYKLCPIILGSIKYRKDKKIDKVQESKFFKNFFHGVLGGSTAQISAFIDTWLASFLISGSISYLYYGNRLFQLPLALFAIALSIGIFPKISKLIKAKKEEDAKNLLGKGFWFLLFLLCFSTLVGIFLSNEIIKVLFQRGQFSTEDVIKTAQVLSMYLIGLVPFGLSRIFSLWLFAHQRQKEAAAISAIALGVNIVLSVVLVYYYEIVGLALAGSLAGWTLFILTIRAYGVKNFLDIINFKKLIILFMSLICVYFVLVLIKGMFNAYL